VRHIIRRLPLACFLLLAVCLLAPAYLFAQTFSGKCVGVTDGDTIKVLRDGREAKIRLEGIDCPETGEPFSAKAKKFTSSLVFGKTVAVSLANPLKSSYFNDCDLKR
jgi:endonuclease YncB( thermonuclease family)